MKAAVVDGNNHIQLADLPEPILDEYDCLVKTEALAFCNSTDRHIVEGHIFGLSYPAVLGHESVGRIVQAGAKARHLKNGDRVLRPNAVYPGQTLGGYASAWGGFAEYTKVRDWRSMADDGLIDRAEPPFIHHYQQVVPSFIPADEAVLLIAQKEIYSCVQQIPQIPGGGRYLIAGAGVTAVLFGQFLRQRGDHVAMTARRLSPLEFAQRRGRADEITLLSESAALGRNFDALIETTGSIPAAVPLLEHVRGGGNVYAYAVYEGMGDESIYAPFQARHTFARINPAEASAHEAVCELARSSKLNGRDLISCKVPFSELERAWQTIVGKQSLKTVMMLD